TAAVRTFALCLLALPAAASDRIFSDGFDTSCVTDTDGDRLADCEEMALGLSMTSKDTDEDGLTDGDEVLGTLDGLDLPGLGAKPRHKQIFVELDWTSDASGCASHSHAPSQFAMQGIVSMFKRAPVANPDGI
ncbi:hypothetical protein, partial [Stutzerimonas stutzeri]|uniref:hypothetical protein n=1 Tax=Stutzerimonas stutzeri TaxID=316 RepID=UPI000B317FA1